MTALGFYKPGPQSEPPAFEAVEMERPAATGKDLLVEVRAVSVNPTDYKTRDTKDPDDDSLTIVGRDVAGVVVETGEDCSLFQVGDEVFYAGTNVRAGGHSEFHLVDERIVGKKPKSLDFAHAAALPLTSLTAMEALFVRLGISRSPEDNAGKNILIIGAAGGVGSVATQLAKLIGLTVIGTASRSETIEWAKDHGADYTINHHEPLKPQLEELGIEGAHYIFCLTNVDDHMKGMADVILPQGKICSILPTFQPLAPALFGKSVTFVYELMYTRSMFQTEDMIDQHHLLNELADWVDTGKIRSTMNEQLAPINPTTLKEAYEKLMTGRTIGKIVLEGPVEK
ncbi:zinc-binding alcohol dehydrogenase family protein [Planococcus salinus]|uniref:Zinc-type alcohol dehydrogenase-like protein n=1 Tax=Planococcus salinus TaxID=1848460 RepID=A0A3M8PEQ4_9BACL|nr:zinc-binding alcohol dehydrogenase family protein [Planococcus salinus]RNF41264.1 zinc-binding alcohol dehydrogenase family protein [Planococcus salinus]